VVDIAGDMINVKGITIEKDMLTICKIGYELDNTGLKR
jgi:hypothetical protein